MTPSMLMTLAINPAMTLLPAKMNTPEAARMLVAICVQESGLKYRQQVLRHGQAWWEWRGPARGWPQFEPTGLKGVLTHPASAPHAARAMELLGYRSPASAMPVWLSDLHASLKHNDVLALTMARLLLWTLPQPMALNQYAGLAQYLDAWRPGAWFRGTEEKKLELKRRWATSWASGEVALI